MSHETLWQENFYPLEGGRAEVLSAALSLPPASSNPANQSGAFISRCLFRMSRMKRRKAPRESVQNFLIVYAQSMR
ncbi:MAG: hypothetical protein DME93_06565 [Verrucomicrobia bacterium]|nr:MAG: hypothetical protein DME93_06565 [Verrucomicrobiota bacterium]